MRPTSVTRGGNNAGRGALAEAAAMADVFAALGEPTRAALLARLAVDGRGTATSLTPFTQISRQAVDRHLRVLAGAGLVETSREGREVVYALKPRALERSAEWLERLGRQWEGQLMALKGEAESGGPASDVAD